MISDIIKMCILTICKKYKIHNPIEFYNDIYYYHEKYKKMINNYKMNYRTRYVPYEFILDTEINPLDIDIYFIVQGNQYMTEHILLEMLGVDMKEIIKSLEKLKKYNLIEFVECATNKKIKYGLIKPTYATNLKIFQK